MEILNVTTNFFRNEAISRTFLFEDDKSVDIELGTNYIIDADGFMVVPENRLKKIEEKANIKIVR